MATLQEILQRSQGQQQTAAPVEPAGGQAQRVQDLLRLKQSGKAMTAGSGPKMSSLAEKQAGVAGEQQVQQQRQQASMQQSAAMQQAEAQEQQLAGSEQEADMRSKQIVSAHQNNMANISSELEAQANQLSVEEAAEKMNQLLAAEALASKGRISHADIASARKNMESASVASRRRAETRFAAIISGARDMEKFKTDEFINSLDYKKAIAQMDVDEKIEALRALMRTEKQIGIISGITQATVAGADISSSAGKSGKNNTQNTGSTNG